MATLQKIRSASFAELTDRGRQKALRVAERLGLSRDATLPNDDQFLEELGVSSSADLVRHLRGHSNSVWYPSFQDLDATKTELRRRFPDEEKYIISAADIICEGYFDILGHKRLNFGRPIPNWHFDPIAGNSMPKIHWSLIDEIDGSRCDKKVIWELNRHQYFLVLGRAYELRGNERYARLFVKHLENWFEMNPPKTGVNWLSSLEVSFRSISWIWALMFFRRSPALTPEFVLEWMKFIKLSGKHLANYLSRYSSPNTHLTGEALGLFMIAVTFPELSDSREWRDLGYSVLMDALDFQILPDGGYCEQASHYHRYTADLYLNFLILLRAEGMAIDPKLPRKLTMMLSFLGDIAQPNGETPIYGDDDAGRLYFLDRNKMNDFRPTQALGAVLLDNERAKFFAGDAGPELLWLLGREGLARFDEIAAIEPLERCRLHRQSGVLSVRDSWGKDADHLLAHCGRHGFMNGGHAHADALSFVFSHKGTPLFIDSGTYTYTADPVERERFRSADAHNCMTINGISSSVSAGPFSWKNQAEAEVIEFEQNEGSVRLRARHDGFEKLGVIYERELEFVDEKYLLVTDDVKTKNEVECKINFILASDITARIESGRARLECPNGRIVKMRCSAELNGKAVLGKFRIEPWTISPKYGVLEKTSRIVFSAAAKGRLRISTRVEAEHNAND